MNEIEGAGVALAIISEQVRGLDSSAEMFSAQIESARVTIEQASEQVVAAEARRDRLIAAGYAIALANGIFWEPYPEPEPEPEPELEAEADPQPEPQQPFTYPEPVVLEPAAPAPTDDDEPVLADAA